MATAAETTVHETVVLGGRDIAVKAFNDAQFLIVQREVRILVDPSHGDERQLEGLDRLMRVINASVVEPTDRTFIDDMMIEGKIDILELVTALFGSALEQMVIEMKAKNPAPTGPKVRRSRASTKR